MVNFDYHSQCRGSDKKSKLESNLLAQTSDAIEAFGFFAAQEDHMIK